jgi:hypothetical protein
MTQKSADLFVGTYRTSSSFWAGKVYTKQVGTGLSETTVLIYKAATLRMTTVLIVI